MIGSRALSSLAQYLELHDSTFVVVLLNKHKIRTTVAEESLLNDILRAIRGSSQESILSLCEELARTRSDLRARISPKYRHDERFNDLSKCLLLDGYVIDAGKMHQIDPSISDVPPIEDELIQALESSSFSGAAEISNKITASAKAFRSAPPDYNACLNGARVALESLAREIARWRSSPSSPPYDPTKWGAILIFLKQVGFISQEEERGLAGVYGFISPGSHRPVGITEEQMARLGRSLALSMCWFLIKRSSSVA